VTLSPGIHDRVAGDVYHADELGATPSLSASVANVLVNRSPAHAAALHPKLNPDLEREEAAKFDVGTAAHALFLQGEDVISVYVGYDWRTKDAKAFRDEQRALGKIPLLLSQAGDVRSMVAAAHAQIERHRARPPLFTDGKPEQTLVWKDEHDVVCRARLDWLRDDYEAVDDMKTSSRSARPRDWGKSTMWSIGAPLQARFYQRGVERLTGIRPAFRFAVVETEPPYALGVVSLSPAAEAIADAQLDYAIRIWAECVEKDDWPAYEPDVHHVDAPGWIEWDWLERMSEEALA
jgi:hypothetical protein